MKEFFEKIKERLENEVQYQQQKAHLLSKTYKVSGKQARLKMAECYEHAIEIVNQVAEEYQSTMSQVKCDASFSDGYMKAIDDAIEKFLEYGCFLIEWNPKLSKENLVTDVLRQVKGQAVYNLEKMKQKEIEIVNQIAEEYEKDIVGGSKKPKYVSIGAYKQVAWERDIAIEQLHELGYDFGQKIDVPDKNIGEIDEVCEWKRDNDEFDIYDTKCKNRHVFFEGSPIDNEYEYCPYCGKELKVVE